MEPLTAATMTPLAEGGFFRRTFADDAVSHIFYLLPAGETSRWHRLAADEIWLFHRGGPIELTLGGTGDAPAYGATCRLDSDHLVATVPKGTWQTARALGGDAVVSCVVAPAYTDAICTLREEEP